TQPGRAGDVSAGWAGRRSTARGLATRAQIVQVCARGLNAAVVARPDTDRPLARPTGHSAQLAGRRETIAAFWLSGRGGQLAGSVLWRRPRRAVSTTASA